MKPIFFVNFMTKLIYKMIKGRFDNLCIIISSVTLMACSNDDNYYNYLCEVHADSEMIDTEVFYREAMNFWMDRVDTLEEFSFKQNDTLRLFLEIQEDIRNSNKYDSLRFENEIKSFVDYDLENTKPENSILFIGSSTVNLWKTSYYFPEYKVMNRGFGGACIKDIQYYYNDVIGKYCPSSVVIYDDIDIENGKSVETVFCEYGSLLDRIHNDFPECRILFISIKPTPMDFLLGKDVRKNKKLLNKRMKEYAGIIPYIEYVDLASLLYKADGVLDLRYYSEDRMHFNESGYKLWSNELRKVL